MRFEHRNERLLSRLTTSYAYKKPVMEYPERVFERLILLEVIISYDVLEDLKHRVREGLCLMAQVLP